MVLLLTLTIVIALPKPDFKTKLEDENGKKCTLEREKSQVRPDCFFEPECHWECSQQNGSQTDEVCRS